MNKEVLHIAIENLAKQGIEVQLKPNDRIAFNGGKLVLDILYKKELRQYQLDELKEQSNGYMLVSEHLSAKIKEQLRASKIAYLEANGNIFVNTDNCFLFVDTNKKLQLKKETSNKAFTATGLKVLFQLLIKPDLINQTQREIATEANVGLGNIPQIIDGLKELGYLLRLKKGEYVWEHKEELLKRWCDEYTTKLRPKLHIGAFTGEPKQLKLDNKQTTWGGEKGAEILTNYLRPEKFLLYTKLNKIDLIKTHRLRPSESGNIEVLEMFWDNDTETAPPLLIYAELISTREKRNVETAEIIYNDYIKPNL